MKLSQLAKDLELEFRGDDVEVNRLNAIKSAKEDELIYINAEKHLVKLESTKAKAVIVDEKLADKIPEGMSVMLTSEPYLIMARVSQLFHKINYKPSEQSPQISENAIVEDFVTIKNGAIIKDNVVLMHGVYIGENVVIEEGSVIHPNSVIYANSKIGKNCTILANATIGSDGFGYAHTKLGEHVKIIHSGNVILGDGVDVGAGTTIDRGVFGSTTIKKGTKIDNLVQIGHNCKMGEGCIIVAQGGFAGSSILGNGVIMGGQSAVAGHISIGDRAIIAARGGVTKSLEGGKTYSGVPILEHKDWLRLQAKISKFFSKK